MMVKNARVKTCSKSHPEKRNIEKDGKGIPKIEIKTACCNMPLGMFDMLSFFRAYSRWLTSSKGWFHARHKCLNHPRVCATLSQN